MFIAERDPERKDQGSECEEGKVKNKVLVIGLDAATWNLIKPWVEQGKLPTIEGIMREGVWGELESSIPFFTSPAWKCYSTGKNPGKLGAFAFFDLDRKDMELKCNTSVSFKGGEIWDYLGQNGIRCGIINMPLTYPPKQVNGFMISGMPARDWSTYTYPRELKERLVREYNYKIEPEHPFLSSNKDKTILELKEIVKNRFRVAKSLLKTEGIDFLQLTIFVTDRIQHFLWQDMEANDVRYGRVIEEFWTMVDAEIAKLLDEVGDEKNLFVVSDHGFTKLKAVFHLNTWFREKGYLHLKPVGASTIPSILSTIGLTRDRIAKLLRLTHMRNLFRIIPFQKAVSIRLQIPTSKDTMGILSLVKSIDWEKTKAITVGETCVYINLPSNSSEYEKFCERLIVEMKSIVDPATGEAVFKDIKRKEQIYQGEFSSIAPDLLIIPNEGYRPLDTLTKKHLWDYSRRTWSGYHKLHGVFLAHGPNIQRGLRINNASIYDMAPTILYLYGLPVPADMDGKVLTNIFAKEFVKEHPVRYQKAKEEGITEKERLSREDEEEIKERLRKLGYFE